MVRRETFYGKIHLFRIPGNLLLVCRVPNWSRSHMRPALLLIVTPTPTILKSKVHTYIAGCLYVRHASMRTGFLYVRYSHVLQTHKPCTNTKQNVNVVSRTNLTLFRVVHFVFLKVLYVENAD
jgi:hypothetical protein